MLPFTHDEFLDVVRDYNLAIWPAQLVAYGLGFSVLALLLVPGLASSRTILAVLALMWLWTAIAHHGLFFSRINDAAIVFSSLFALQALILIWAAWAGKPGKFGIRRSAAGWVELGLCAYALFLYPLIVNRRGIRALTHFWCSDGAFALDRHGRGGSPEDRRPCPRLSATSGWFQMD